MSIVGVKINEKGKVSYFNGNNLPIKKNLTVIVDTERGPQFAKVMEILDVPDNPKYTDVIRIATKKDYLQYMKNINDAEKALDNARKLAIKEELNMNIIDAVYSFDRSQLIFRFLADERVDFRQLARELGSKLRTRIELRQIGIRDKAK